MIDCRSSGARFQLADYAFDYPSARGAKWSGPPVFMWCQLRAPDRPAAAEIAASGNNSALRELGGVAGVAILASAFTRHGRYASPHVFITGFTAAIWVAVGPPLNRGQPPPSGYLVTPE